MQLTVKHDSVQGCPAPTLAIQFATGIRLASTAFKLEVNAVLGCVGG